MPSRATIEVSGEPSREFSIPPGAREEPLPGVVLHGSDAAGVVVESVAGAVRVNGRRLRPGERWLLRPGGEATVGEARIVGGWDDPGTAVEARAILRAALRGEAPSAGAELVALSGPSAGRRYPVRPGVLGRAFGSTIRLDDPAVSRRHARIEVDGSCIRIADLRSRNGCFVGEERLSGLRELRPGDELRAGQTVLSLGLLAEIPVARPPSRPPSRPARSGARAALLAAAGVSIVAALLVLG
ncbi:MAG: FHA domain-containing protein [Deltaproteobacteria bacterium]